MDFYRKLLAKAQWDWLEQKYCRFYKRLGWKDRTSGRTEKRKARNLEKKSRENEW
jgi:hypothetical protein